ncbi:ATP-binding cassette domain-containing protein [Diplocloster agilis]|uniref:ATP-binding cassette domain-containing protein n=1 Tax=Diplocloster agilis TaxID=2850323 RepID=UPI00130D504F|nr:sugar ABC transporter ATP-binding protein [Suonthocola fibrivorans]MCU6732332.1 sugar ABC transporter ATP-binding protein [Suonthocola fibrivorans]
MQGITKEFSGTKALDDVNFKVLRGQIHALVGENGAGKSTLMNILSGLYPFGTYSGKIIYNGEECQFHQIKDSEKKGIVIIHQELALIPYLSVTENVFLGDERRNRHGIINWTQLRGEALQVLKEVGLENENVDQPVNKLGVGKQQLVEIAKALAKDAKLLILDEPTSALNDEESVLLLELLLKLKKQGITSILISHKLHEVTKVADEITILRDGHTIETLTEPDERTDENRIIKGMVGREVTQRFPPRNAVVGKKVMEVENWTVYHPDYKMKKVIDDVSFHAEAGEVVGFAGLMGSGRTELAMSIFGRTYGSAVDGVVKINGRPADVSTVDKAIRAGIAYMTEDRKMYGLVLFNDIKWNISLPNLDKISRHSVIQKNVEETMAEEVCRNTRVKARSIRQKVSDLSGGNQQKVLLSKWITASPDVLILDEPTRGIDVGAKYEIYSVINELASQGKSIIVISSDMTELLGISDRIYVLSEGRIAGEFKKEEATQAAIMKAIMDQQARSNDYAK